VPLPGPRIPIATYRLQFNASFTFRDAAAIVDYLADLGISDAYASSYLCATPGSRHGYDVADPTRLNPEVGTDDEFHEWVAALRRRGMGQILDLVPNHMGIARSANPWWMDVLENGPASRFAAFFDIAWQPSKDELADKVLIPTLGDQYGAVLERQELRLEYANGAFLVRYFDDWFPIAPDTTAAILAPALDAWIADADRSPAKAESDELRSIITAAEHLPPRTASAGEAVAIRDREKEIVKRRLASLVARCAALLVQLQRVLEALNGRPGDPASFDALDALLNQQSYRLAHWRTASEEINYRRFFDVNQLAALRMEDPAVFDEVHRFALDLVARGAATGLRVDHVDGLFAPGNYLRRLQSRVAADAGMPGDGRPVYLVVEKILGADERLPAWWPVHGTTGYEFASAVNGLFVDGAHARDFDRIYERVTGWRRDLSFDDLAYAAKKRVMHETMSGDINSLGYRLNRVSERNRHFRDFTLYSLISAIKEVVACFPVYRTYITDEGPLTEHDRRYVERAVAAARRASPSLNALVFDFLRQILLDEPPARVEVERDERLCFIGKFQQITSPVAAKGIEDTALYVYNRLIALNEVGGDPTVFGRDPREVHRWMQDRQRLWPAALSATATHDTKRGEDTRVRIDVLSEVPAEWKAAVTRWRRLNRRLKPVMHGRPVPDPNEEYFLYQTLVGAWPCDVSDEPAFVKRLEAYLRKALREAKVNTSWLAPDEAYEEAVLAFARRILEPGRPFLAAFRPFQRRVADAGIVNGLAQLTVKVTAPGVPDFYQGTELWDLSLVDPDNRRPVDYARRQAWLAALPPPSAAGAADLWHARDDGRIKLFTMKQALSVRSRFRRTFDAGTYIPLDATGPGADHVFAFLRSAHGIDVITCVPRLTTALPAGDAGAPLGADAWGDAMLILPRHLVGRSLGQAFTGETFVPAADDRGGAAWLPLARLFAHLPVALLTTVEGPRA